MIPKVEEGSDQEKWVKEEYGIEPDKQIENKILTELNEIEGNLTEYVHKLQINDIYFYLIESLKKKFIDDFKQGNPFVPLCNITYFVHYFQKAKYIKLLITPPRKAELDMIELKITAKTTDEHIYTLLDKVNSEIENSEINDIKKIIKNYNDSLKILNRVNPFIRKKNDEVYFGKIKDFYDRVLDKIRLKIDKRFNEETFKKMAEECNALREKYFKYKKNQKSFEEWERVTEQEFEQKLERIEEQKEYNRKIAEDNRKRLEEQNRKARERMNDKTNKKPSGFASGLTAGITAAAIAAQVQSGGSKKNKRNKKHKTLRKKNTRRRTRRQKRH